MVNPFADIPADDLEYFRRQAATFASSGGEAASPRLAATVVLLRPDGAVLLMRRSMGMVFGGRWAFPGGSVDAADAVGGGSQLAVAARAAVREVREETGLQIAEADLIAWSRWVTPVFEPRRFDTYFFLGVVPAGTDAVTTTSEAEAHLWLTPAEAVRGYFAAELPMLPPTAVTLRELAELGDLEAIRSAAAGRDPSAVILPTLPAADPAAG
jgi:8-oxo-dGTP pyrophosphatase MutT (NUDIX family)